MAKFTLQEAAEKAGISRPTMYRKVQSGQISAQRDEHGHHHIDAAEFYRVFPDAFEKAGEKAVEQSTNSSPNGAEREVIGLLKGQIDDVKRERDHWREQAEKVTLLLSPPAAAPATVDSISWQTVALFAIVAAFVALAIWFRQ
jgi:excisionase family DNA binding protein